MCDLPPCYFSEPKQGLSGGWMMFVSNQEGSNDPNDNVTMQFGAHDSPVVCPFGIDGFEGRTQDEKRDLSVQVGDGCLATVLEYEKRTIATLAKRSKELWGKEKSEEIIAETFTSSIKMSKDGAYPARVKCKIVLPNDAGKKPAEVFIGGKVTLPCSEFPSGHVEVDGLPCGDAPTADDVVRAVQPFSKCMIKARLGTVWKSAMGCGLSIYVTHLIVWEPDDRQMKSVFDFKGAAVSTKRSLCVEDEQKEKKSRLGVADTAVYEDY